MRLPERQVKWQVGGCLPFVHLWCEHDGGKYWPVVHQFEF